MPQPTSTPATLRPDLGGSMEEFDLAADRLGFVGPRVAPTIESAEQASTFGKIPVEQLLKTPEVSRASGGGYNRGSWKFETASFATQDYGWEEVVDDREARIYRHYFDAELVSADIARDVVTRAAEIRIQTLLQNTSTFTKTDVANEWDDHTNCTPIDDVDAAVERMWAAIGLYPNAIRMNRKQFRHLRNSAQIIDRLKYNGIVDVRPGKITAAMLATVFDLEEVIVSGSPKNTANNDQAVSISPIWSDEYVEVIRVARTNNPKEPCVARVFHWSEDGSQIGGTMETYDETKVRGRIVRCRHDVDELVMYAGCGQILGNIITI